MAKLDKWLMRAAIVGVTAGTLGAAFLWLVLTRPVAVAMVLDRTF